MADDEVRVVVMLETADESSVPLEVASRVEDRPGVEQTVCSFREPAPETFGVEVEWLGGSHRLDPSAYRRLRGMLGDADVLHVHPNATGAIARLVSVTAGAAAVSTEHNTHTDYGPLKRLVVGTTTPLGDAVVSVSEAVADSFARWERALLRVAGTDRAVIHNGVDVEGVRAAADRPVPVDLPDGTLVGAGGRLVGQKNLGALLAGLARAVGDHPELRAVVTGDGPLRDDLEARADDLGIADHVVFTGYLPERADVHALLSRLDLYAMPSHHEGFPVAALEAMAAGLPVLANDIPQLREAVGDAGLFRDADDPAAVGAALATLAADDERRRELGAAALDRAGGFSLDRTVDQHVALYRTLAG